MSEFLVDENYDAGFKARQANKPRTTRLKGEKRASWIAGWDAADSGKAAPKTKKKAPSKTAKKSSTAKKAPAAKKTSAAKKPASKKTKGSFAGISDSGEDWQVSGADGAYILDQLAIALTSYKTRSDHGYFPEWDKQATLGWMPPDFILSRKGIQLVEQAERIDILASNAEQAIRRCGFLTSKRG